MEKNTTNILLVIIAIFLCFISYQLITNKTVNENQKEDVAQNQKTQDSATIISTSVTRTKNFSFASWSNTSNKVSENPETYILFNNKDTDPFSEKVVYTKNFSNLSNNPGKNSLYSFVSNSTFGLNKYEIYEQKENKTRVFILKKNSEAILVFLGDSEVLVPHYVDLSSLKFTAK